MYKCELCGKISKPQEKTNFIVLKKRKKIYHHRPSANRQKDEEGKWRYVPDNGGEGYETVSEARCCMTCAQQRKGSQATIA